MPKYHSLTEAEKQEFLEKPQNKLIEWSSYDADKAKVKERIEQAYFGDEKEAVAEEMKRNVMNDLGMRSNPVMFVMMYQLNKHPETTIDQLLDTTSPEALAAKKEAFEDMKKDLHALSGKAKDSPERIAVNQLVLKNTEILIDRMVERIREKDPVHMSDTERKKMAVSDFVISDGLFDMFGQHFIKAGEDVGMDPETEKAVNGKVMTVACIHRNIDEEFKVKEKIAHELMDENRKVVADDLDDDIAIVIKNCMATAGRIDYMNEKGFIKDDVEYMTMDGMVSSVTGRELFKNSSGGRGSVFGSVPQSNMLEFIMDDHLSDHVSMQIDMNQYEVSFKVDGVDVKGSTAFENLTEQEKGISEKLAADERQYTVEGIRNHLNELGKFPQMLKNRTKRFHSSDNYRSMQHDVEELSKSIAEGDASDEHLAEVQEKIAAAKSSAEKYLTGKGYPEVKEFKDEYTQKRVDAAVEILNKLNEESDYLGKVQTKRQEEERRAEKQFDAKEKAARDQGRTHQKEMDSEGMKFLMGMTSSDSNLRVKLMDVPEGPGKELARIGIDARSHLSNIVRKHNMENKPLTDGEKEDAKRFMAQAIRSAVGDKLSEAGKMPKQGDASKLVPSDQVKKWESYKKLTSPNGRELTRYDIFTFLSKDKAHKVVDLEMQKSVERKRSNSISGRTPDKQKQLAEAPKNPAKRERSKSFSKQA